jgi:pantoate--beta-alanine ligase
MKIFHTISDARAACRESRVQGKCLGLVPTMGALHEGHLSLIRAAKAQCGSVVVSIFVNPTQFGPNEDLSKYPRPFEHDRQLLESEGVEMLFAPSAEEMYPGGETTWVVVDGLSEKLDGRSRPGHFRGVATVVAKLFNIIAPQCAFFGQKDAAQLAVIRHMVKDLSFPTQIVACPIIRETDGLAMSSRNVYLTPEDRRRAVVLRRSLQRVQQDFHARQATSAQLVSAGKSVIASEPGVVLDYFEIVDPDTLDPVDRITQNALVAVAAYLGTTRLIDNVLLVPETK